MVVVSAEPPTVVADEVDVESADASALEPADVVALSVAPLQPVVTSINIETNATPNLAASIDKRYPR